jgi:ABC-type glycerol-3-phosphate transport system substrate-binding protein
MMIVPDRQVSLTRRSLLHWSLAAPTAALAACQARPQRPQESAGPKRQVTLIWSSWATDDYGKFREQERIDIWLQKHPDSGITVEMANFPSGEYKEKILAQLAGGVGPDVFRLGWSDVFPFMEGGQIAELDPWFKKFKDSWMSRPDLKKWIIDGARYRGKLYGTPMGGDMSSMFLNKTLLEREGIPAPTIGYRDVAYRDWTFERVLDYARRLTKRSGDAVTQYGIDVSYGSGNPFSLVESFGGRTLSDKWDELLWHEEPAVRAWQWLADLRLVHRVAPTPEESRAFNFVNGTLGMAWTLVSQLTYRTQDVRDTFDWDQAPWPHAEGRDVKVMFWYSAWVMNQATRYPEEAFAWLHHVSGPEGTIPGVELGWELPLFKELDARYNKRIAEWKKNIKPPLEGLDFAIQRHYYHHPKWSELWSKYVGPALSEIVTGKAPAAQKLREIKPSVDELLKQGAALMQ